MKNQSFPSYIVKNSFPSQIILPFPHHLFIPIGPLILTKAILPPRGHVAMFEVVFSCYKWAMLLGRSGQKPRMLPSILQCTRHPLPQTKNYLVKTINSATAENSY